MAKVIEISASKLKANDPAEVVRFSYYADPERFVQAFNNVGVSMSEQDLPALINYIITGKDKKGVLKAPANSKNPGAPIAFDGMNVIHNIVIRHDMLDKSGIKII
jgi:hypothetical protein